MRMCEGWEWKLQHGQASADIHTPSQSSTLGNIRAIHGPAVARELLELKHETPERSLEDEEEDRLVVKAHGYLSNANYNSKRATFILFINHRLVEIGRASCRERVCQYV